jgi:hypothetical protein
MIQFTGNLFLLVRYEVSGKFSPVGTYYCIYALLYARQGQTHVLAGFIHPQSYAPYHFGPIFLRLKGLGKF